MIPERMLDRYVKVRRLAERGQAGERLSAQRVLAKLEKEYPNIRAKAEEWERLTEGDVPDPEPRQNYDEPPHWSDVYQQQQTQKRNAQWKQKFTEWGQSASNAFSWMADMASQAFSAQEARVLATENKYTKIQVRHNESGSVTLNVRITPELHNYLAALNEEQQAVYANTVAQRVAADLYSMLQ